MAQCAARHARCFRHTPLRSTWFCQQQADLGGAQPYTDHFKAPTGGSPCITAPGWQAWALKAGREPHSSQDPVLLNVRRRHVPTSAAAKRLSAAASGCGAHRDSAAAWPVCETQGGLLSQRHCSGPGRAAWRGPVLSAKGRRAHGPRAHGPHTHGPHAHGATRSRGHTHGQHKHPPDTVRPRPRCAMEKSNWSPLFLRFERMKSRSSLERFYNNCSGC